MCIRQPPITHLFRDSALTDFEMLNTRRNKKRSEHTNLQEKHSFKDKEMLNEMKRNHQAYSSLTMPMVQVTTNRQREQPHTKRCYIIWKKQVTFLAMGQYYFILIFNIFDWSSIDHLFFHCLHPLFCFYCSPHSQSEGKSVLLEIWAEC